MRSFYPAPFVLVAALAVTLPARADVNVVKNEDVNLNVGAMGQVVGFGEKVDDPVRDDARALLVMKAARLRLNGDYKGYRFNLEMAIGGEATVAAPSPGVSLGLLDLSFDVPLRGLGSSFIRVGQFKVPYGREALTYSGLNTFTDRSIAFLGTQMGRDVGATLNLRGEKATFIAGIFTGGGRDVPQTYIPEKLGVPLLVVRAGWGDVDGDLYNLNPSAQKTDKLKAAVFANALYSKDSLIGHSSVFNVKMANKSLLLNGNWNPFIGKAPLDQGALWQTGIDGVVRKPLGNELALGAEAEVNYGGYFNKFGAIHLVTARVQGNVAYKSLEVALRYAAVLPDKNFAFNNRSVTGKDAIHEVTPAVSYYLAGNRVKAILDFPLLFGTPVVQEAGIGSYVLTSMPNQTTALQKEANTIVRQNVQQARLMFQTWF
jgi:hypothetical protein